MANSQTANRSSPVFKLPRGCKENIQIDSGANVFVVNNKKYLHNFTERTINVTLGTNITGQFEGTGLIIASTPQKPGFYVLLFPAILASQDPCCTMTTGGLKKYSGFKSIMHDIATEMTFTHESGNKFTLPCTTERTIDYVKLTLHPVSQN